MRLPDYNPTVVGMIRAIAEKYGDAEAVARDGDRLTFRQLETRSATVAKALLAAGAGKGSRIALLLPPRPEYVVYLFAIGRIGAIALPLSTLYQAPELQWVLENSEADYLITADSFMNHDYLTRIEEALPGLAGALPPFRLHTAPRLRKIWVLGDNNRPWSRSTDALSTGDEAFDDEMLRSIEAQVTPSDPWLIIYTSGSTANPKGIIHSQGAFVRHSYHMSYDFYPFQKGDRVISNRAMFWVAGLVATLSYALQAGACVITTTDGSAKRVLELIEVEGGVGLAGDSGWFDVLRDSSEFKAAGIDVVRLNMDKAGFARNGRFLSDGVEQRYGPPRHPPVARIARSFGMTETLGAHTSVRWDELLPDERPSWQGRAIPGIELRIVDPKTREILPPWQLGELMVKGYTMMLGINGMERGDVFDADGFYATGDLCMLDEQGYMKFESRMGEMIKIHGANVAPMEVELAMLGVMGIEKVGVVGIEENGETVLTAAVLMAPGRELDAAAVTAELKRKLSSFKVPKRILALSDAEMPQTGSGKIKKSSLIKLLSSQESITDGNH
ncbi:AMP-binding protein [Sphingorhabdus sp.]|jgi:acyl-coenzyme A synthetase/AMP-(fatty) acid ligase|uniref:class I adenylate-forming enzyme family protein n=1 Tax=Sphingorhabdus sp. TaxID=1902408 RepID=UPI0037C8EFDD